MILEIWSTKVCLVEQKHLFGRLFLLTLPSSLSLYDIYIAKELQQYFLWQKLVTFLKFCLEMPHHFRVRWRHSLPIISVLFRRWDWSIWILILSGLISFSQFLSCHYNIEQFSLLSHKFQVKLVRLHQSWTIKLVLDNLFLDDSLTKSELVHTVNEILFRNIVTLCCLTHTLNSCNPYFFVFDNFFETKKLIFA